MRIAYLFLGICLLISTATFAQNKQITVVIDPGHGGVDPGHLSGSSTLLPEKTLNLKIAKYLGGYIEKYLQNVKVIYTRTDDSFPSLDARVAKANGNNADYFISIHCNGNERKSVRGTETHVHSMSLKKSVAFGKAIEKQFSSRAGRKSRGVKDKKDLKHSLQVLKFTNMTSVLVECGFVTNEKEARYLNSTYGQEILASAIFRAFRETIEKNHTGIKFRKTAPTTTPSTTGDTPVVASTEPGVFGIQIASSRKPVDAKKDPIMRKADAPVEMTELNTSNAYKYIYLVGNYATRKEAKKALIDIQKKGFKDAFVTKR
ncbi:MAG: N-acetylmuramoyl-L-alanine amidase [Crocinitomicaceae bacterium]|nr:N-acetylmuramoyl-L-alanine amidase [Crocinitomicaceae bacterium]